jgi:pyrroline-5-carboxylate reductase
MNLGFIGTGKITYSVINGIHKSPIKFKKIYISYRNSRISKKLKQNFEFVKVLKNNQEIINKSNVLFLAVTPLVGFKILKSLKFSKKKKIISFISTISLANLKRILKQQNIIRVIPLPPIESKKGPIILYPPNKFAKNFFKNLGFVIEINNEKKLNSFWSTSALMAPFYELLNVSTNWLSSKGINKNNAINYVSELFLGLAQDATNKKSKGFKKLVAESQTPKGLNEQALKELKKSKFYSKLNNTLNSIHKRMNKAK